MPNAKHRYYIHVSIYIVNITSNIGMAEESAEGKSDLHMQMLRDIIIHNEMIALCI